MGIIQKALNSGLVNCRQQLIDECCPYDVDRTMPDVDFNTYKTKESKKQERGCRGMTCEECWEKYDHQH